MRRIEQEIVEPTYDALKREGLSYAGVLYFGLMITAAGPRVLEFNVRFGDPETQVLLPVLPFDLGGLLKAVMERNLRSFAAGVDTSSPVGAALGVVIAARGYPEASSEAVPVQILTDGRPDHTHLFHASSFRNGDGSLCVKGGRCFTAVGRGTDLQEAARRAYATADKVRFDGCWYRSDIGREVLRRIDMKDVLFVIGSQSDEAAVKPAISLMEEKGMSFDLKVLSAHRNLEELITFLKDGEKSYRLVIAAAGSFRCPSRRDRIRGEASRHRRAPGGRPPRGAGRRARNSSAAPRRPRGNHGARPAGRSQRRAPCGANPRGAAELSRNRSVRAGSQARTRRRTFHASCGWRWAARLRRRSKAAMGLPGSGFSCSQVMLS